MIKANREQYIKLLVLADRFKVDSSEVIDNVIVDNDHNENVVFVPYLGKDNIIVVLPDGSSHS